MNSFMKYFRKLEGDNIYLSPRNIEDVEVFTEWLNDFETTDYIGRSSQILTLDEEKEYIENQVHNEASFVIVKKENDQVIGAIDLKDIDHVNRIATLGIFIGDKENRNKGYGTEAIEMLLEYGFHYLNLNNIMLWVMSFNDRAVACYKKCGFQEIGKRRKSRFINGVYYDQIEMDILAEEFHGNYIRNKHIGK